MSYSPIPAGELMKAHFDIDHTELKKEVRTPQNIILSFSVKSHIVYKHLNHLKYFTGGSVLENEQEGALGLLHGV